MSNHKTRLVAALLGTALLSAPLTSAVAGGYHGHGYGYGYGAWPVFGLAAAPSARLPQS